MRARLLDALATLALARPRAVIAVAALLAWAGVALLPTLTIETSRLALIDADVGASVGARADLVAAVTADDERAGRRATEALAAALRHRLPEASGVLARVDPTSFAGRELTLLPPDELELMLSSADAATDLVGALREARRRLGADGSETLDALERRADAAGSDEGLASLAALTEGLARELSGAPRRAHRTNPGGTDDEGFFASRDGRTRYVFVSPRVPSDRYEDVAPMTEAARALGAEVEAGHPGVRVAFTGYPAITTDEVDAIRRGSLLTGALAFALVLALFAFAFRSPGSLALAAIPLGLGIAIAFAMIALTVGELNLLTQVAAPVFAGLGIDFAIHLLAAYDRARATGLEHPAATRAALHHAGPGILAGGLTTSLAFLSLLAAGFDAIRELGWVAGVGLAFILWTVLLVIPALLTLGEARSIRWLRLDGRGAGRRVAREERVAAWLDRLAARPWIALALGAALTAALGAGMSRLRFDVDVEGLAPSDAESLAAAREMRDGSAFTNEHMVAEAADLPSLRALHERLARRPTVARVESLAALLPPDADASRALLEAMRDDPSRAPPPPPAAASTVRVDALRAELVGLAEAADEAARQSGSLGATAIADDLARVAEASRAAARACDDARAPARVRDAERAFASDRARLLDLMRSADPDAPPISEDALPPALVERLTRATASGERRYLAYAYPAADLFSPGALERFVRDVRVGAPDADGAPRALRDFLAHARDGLELAAVLAAALVLLVLVLDFRSGRDALLALAPVTLATVWLLGALGWLGVPLDLANVAALPLLLGIGVDDGVHLVHRRRAASTLRVALAGVVFALVLTSATTLAGFGTIGLAAHRGMRSFALVMTLGTGLCLLATLVVSPALIRLTRRDGGGAA